MDINNYYIELADKKFTEARDKYHADCIQKAKTELRKIELRRNKIEQLLSDAKNGNFLGLVEEYQSSTMAEEFE